MRYVANDVVLDVEHRKRCDALFVHELERIRERFVSTVQTVSIPT